MVRRLSLLLVLALAGVVTILPGAAAGGFCHAEESGMTSSDKTRVAIAKCAFAQTVTYVDRGASVTWTSRDVFPHTVTGAGLTWGSDKVLDRGDSVTYSFEEDGVYPYYCDLHPSMVGAVVVGDGINAAALGEGAAPVKEVLDAAPAAAPEPAQSGSGGMDVAVLAAALVAALGIVLVAGRYASGRRARASTAA